MEGAALGFYFDSKLVSAILISLEESCRNVHVYGTYTKCYLHYRSSLHFQTDNQTVPAAILKKKGKTIRINNLTQGKIMESIHGKGCSHCAQQCHNAMQQPNFNSLMWRIVELYQNTMLPPKYTIQGRLTNQIFSIVSVTSDLQGKIPFQNYYHFIMVYFCP